ncbi:glutamine--fructose-6-phosphate transaminase (isomerizing) [Candidatus Woesearchaeota archaeon]|nr:glutamine--fructose-6-phosphate transaminase (isomerizing) [Candidatus Woesearchaeota archaeon]
MCGIIGYVGEKEAYPILFSGLQRLEYRGYDSAGICTQHQQQLHLCKKKGRVESIRSLTLPGTMGIAHTRWSTHGKPADENAHPFADERQEFSIVHNGIIENYLELKEELRKEGISFSSETDSEVIVHLIARHYHGDLKQAVLAVLPKLQGAYAFCVLHHQTEQIIGARNGSPLILGLGQNEHFLASDVSAVIEHTRRVMYLNDFHIAAITKQHAQVYDFQGNEVPLVIQDVNWSLEQAQKQGYKHFMLKEIFEQPQVVEEQLKVTFDIKTRPSRIHMVACGGASFAGLLGKYLIEKLAKIPVHFELGSEFRHQDPIILPGELVITISQSGETADTLAAIRLATKERAKTVGIINVVGSTMAREVDQVVYTRAGPEISVASTKAFLAQIVSMYQLAFHLAGKEFQFPGYKEHLEFLLSMNERIKELAKKYYLFQNFIYLGRNRNFAIALEGALKLKEIAYIHAEGYPGGELKHGPLALVSEEMPVLAICPQDEFYEKMTSNIQEVKARGGRVISIATEGDEHLRALSDDILYIPKVDSLLYPLLETIPVHLFAYHLADIKECDIDKPRNLAKSVTVE